MKIVNIEKCPDICLQFTRVKFSLYIEHRDTEAQRLGFVGFAIRPNGGSLKTTGQKIDCTTLSSISSK